MYNKFKSTVKVLFTELLNSKIEILVPHTMEKCMDGLYPLLVEVGSFRSRENKHFWTLPKEDEMWQEALVYGLTSLYF